MTQNERARTYKLIISALDDGGSLTKEELFSRALQSCGLNADELCDESPSGKKAKLMRLLSEAADGLCGRGLVICRDDRYSLAESKPVTVRAARCEKEIISMLAGSPMTKKEIRARLEDILGTNKTPTLKDDNVLFSYFGQILKRLTNEKTLTLRDGVYSISRAKSARVGNMSETLELKNEFLERLHSKGGEFFEHYFMTLLSKYLSKHGKTVIESYVTGGSSDGGIDGIAKTVDSLGFRETVMIQTKNRNSYATETEVRGFYGAVCARMGSRGIFVTSSGFHQSAADFLSAIDNCVGLNGDKIFDMASECLFGIKKRDGKLIIDTGVL